jgi:hypothetical protein
VKSEEENNMRFEVRRSTFDVEEKGKRRKAKGKSEENCNILKFCRVLAAGTDTGFH